MDDGEKLARLGFLSGGTFLPARMSGFTDEQKGFLEKCVNEFVKNGENPFAVSLGLGKQVCCPFTILRLSEVAEDEGIDGLKVIHKFLLGRKEPIDYQALYSAYFALMEFRKGLKEIMKGGK